MNSTRVPLLYIPLLILLLSGFLPTLAHEEVGGSVEKELADTCLRIDFEAQVSSSSGTTPLWLNANKYGLSSLEENNGYARASVLRPMKRYSDDKEKRFDYSYCADLAVAYGNTSALIVQQAYAEARWLRGKVTLGSKNWEMELKDNSLSSGSQTLGKNARPIPQLRIGLDEYWTVPYTKNLVGLKASIAYGLFTDQGWQKDFTDKQSKYVENAIYHSKTGYLRIGRVEQPLNLTLGVEMVTAFGGTSHIRIDGPDLVSVDNKEDLKAFWNAFMPLSDKGEVIEADKAYKNTSGNIVGSWLIRLDYKADKWTAALYYDHFFEDHSQMFFLDYDGYQEGDYWKDKKDARFLMYSLKDMMLGLELKSRKHGLLDALVLEYLYTKYQSGPIYHDHTNTIADHIGGNDDYYNNYVQSSFQHWGQVIGNPFFLSPLYNKDGKTEVQNNRFVAYHLGISGHPCKNIDYRLLASFQDGMGTYSRPYNGYKRNFNFLAEASYLLPQSWRLTAAVGLDRGNIHGNNTGAQITARKTIFR